MPKDQDLSYQHSPKPQPQPRPPIYLRDLVVQLKTWDEGQINGDSPVRVVVKTLKTLKTLKTPETPTGETKIPFYRTVKGINTLGTYGETLLVLEIEEEEEE